MYSETTIPQAVADESLQRQTPDSLMLRGF